MSELAADFRNALLALPGIESATVWRYSIRLTRGAFFEWETIRPALVSLIQEKCGAAVWV